MSRPPEPQPRTLSLLHRDEHLVVVDKPANMLVHRGWGRDAIVLVDLLAEQLGARVYPAHRLDRGTSGALVMALDPETAAGLSRAFEAGAVSKTYRALTRGHLREAQVVDHPLRRLDSDDQTRRAARTHVRPLLWLSRALPADEDPRSRRCTWLEAAPETGRTHQIRRHLKHLSHPIVGDVRHGRGPINRAFREAYDLHRLALHALHLEFEHPRTGAPMRFESPLPADLVETMSALGVPPELLARH